MSVKGNFLACLALFYASFTVNAADPPAPGTPAPATSAPATPDSSNNPPSAASSTAPAGDASSSCNMGLLNQLRLSGKEKGSKVAIDACGIPADDSCCSAVDEIKIIKSWNQFTLPKIQKHNNDFGLMLRRISDIVPYVQSLDNSTIRYHADNLSWRRVNETRCVGGGFFAEDTGLDVVKLEKYTADGIREAFAAAVAASLTSAQKAIVPASEVQKAVNAAMNDYQTSFDFSSLLFTVYRDEWLGDIATSVVNQLASLPSTVLDLSGKGKDETPGAYLTKTLLLATTLSAAANQTAKDYATLVIHNRAAVMHLTSLNDFFDQVAANISKAPYNIPAAEAKSYCDLAKDDVYGDEVLQKYIMRVIDPRSEEANFQMVTYTKNRILRIMANAFVRAPSSPFNVSSYNALKKAFQGMSTYSLRGLLQSNYCRILAAFQVFYALPLVVESVYKPGPLTKPQMYVQMARNAFFLSDYDTLKTKTYKDCKIDNAFFGKVMTRIVGIINPMLNYTIAVPATFDAKLADSQKFYESMTPFNRSYSVANLDGKPVCSTYKRHVMVREAVFNSQKYDFCQATLTKFKAMNISTILQNITMYQAQYAEILGMKKGLYCAACSMKASKFVSLEDNSVALSNDFCLSFVQKYASLFTWRSQVFTEYLSSMYQYLRCFSTNARLNQTFPYPDKDNITPQAIPGLADCLTVSSAENIAKCTSFCTQFRVGTYSSVLDGDSKQLTKLYNFIINALRITGRRFGTMPTDSQSTQTTTQKPSRILQEQPAWVKKLAHSKSPRSRRLADPPANQDPPAKSDPPANKDPAAKSDPPASGTPAKPDAKPAPPAPAQFWGRATTAMYLYLAQALETMTTPTRPEGYNHNEMFTNRIAYVPIPPGSSITDLTCTLKPAGIDFLKLSAAASFEMSSLEALQFKNLDVGKEELSPYAIRDCIQVTSDDIKNLGDDLTLVVPPAMPTLTPGPVLKVYDERKFAKYKSKDKSRRLRKQTRGRNERRLHLNKRQFINPRSVLKPKERKPRASGTSITNFLFKLLF